VWAAPASGLIRTRATLAAWINPCISSCSEPQNRSDPTTHRVARASENFEQTSIVCAISERDVAEFGTVRPRVQIPGPRPNSELESDIDRCLLCQRASRNVVTLRHQLEVLLRRKPKPRLRNRDRILWVWMRWLWPEGWTRQLRIVQPETVIAWHRRGCACTRPGGRAVG
jgi:hypothetical protein